MLFRFSDNYNINQEDRNGQTPLMLAVILGEEEIIRLLVRAGKLYYSDRPDNHQDKTVESRSCLFSIHVF